MMLLFISLLVCISYTNYGTLAVPNEDRLYKRFFVDNRYVKTSRPAANASQTTRVDFDYTLIRIVDLDMKRDVLTTHAWSRIYWNDSRLTWNATEYGGQDNIRVSSSDIWTPDIRLYNSGDKDATPTVPMHVVVSSTGACTWIPPAAISTYCPVDVAWFPFDSQLCRMKFTSWTYSGFELDLQSPADRGGHVDLTDYVNSREWLLENATVEKRNIYYSSSHEPYPCLSVDVQLKRTVSFFNVCNVIAPTFLLSILLLFVFMLPPGSGERIALGITILLILTLVQLIVASTVLPTRGVLRMPWISIYILTMMSLCVLNIIVSTIITNLHHRTCKTPNWIRSAFCERLAKLLCLTRPSNNQQLQTDLDLEDASSKKPKENAPQTASSEWKFVAAVIDRLCFCIFASVLFVASLAIFIRVDGRP